jgi:hypothetical protein
MNEEFKLDPREIFQEAAAEPPRRMLDDYREAIRMLKDEKDFTFREIAEWFQQRGMNVDHNAVWRAYAKGMPDMDAHYVAEADERLEQEEALEEAYANGTIVTTNSGSPAEGVEQAKQGAEPGKNVTKAKGKRKGAKKQK